MCAYLAKENNEKIFMRIEIYFMRIEIIVFCVTNNGRMHKMWFMRLLYYYVRFIILTVVPSDFVVSVQDKSIKFLTIIELLFRFPARLHVYAFFNYHLKNYHIVNWSNFIN